MRAQLIVACWPGYLSASLHSFTDFSVLRPCDTSEIDVSRTTAVCAAQVMLSQHHWHHVSWPPRWHDGVTTCLCRQYTQRPRRIQADGGGLMLVISRVWFLPYSVSVLLSWLCAFICAIMSRISVRKPSFSIPLPYKMVLQWRTFAPSATASEISALLAPKNSVANSRWTKVQYSQGICEATARAMSC